MNRKILALAIPNIISNLTVPLLGMVDLAIIGRLENTLLIGGIAIGGTIFNFLYWNFGFLRMGTSGLTAQAFGARRFDEAGRVLLRSLTVAVGIALLIWLLQTPILSFALRVMDAGPEVKAAAADYFRMRVWAAPATLSMYAFSGWFIGMQNARTPMWIAIGINGINIVCSYCAVKYFGMGVSGVALGTVIAQWCGVILALWAVTKFYRRIFSLRTREHLYRWDQIRSFFLINRDIFLRTLCLVAVFTYFTVASSQMGDQVLAVNTLLLQLFTLFSYLMDGFAYAGEALTGRYYGAGNGQQLRRLIRLLIGWGVLIALVFTLLYAVGTPFFLRIFTKDLSLLATANPYKLWVILIPLCSFLAFILDGILVGLSAAKVMRNAMFGATVVFFCLWFVLESRLENNGLWISFLTYLFLRGALQFIYLCRRFQG